MELLNLSNDDKISMLEMAPKVAVDTEGMEHMMGFSVAFSGPDHGFYLPFRHAKDNLTAYQITKVFEVLNSRESLIFHNAMHDLQVLKNEGFDYQGFFWDTMLMAHWINEEMFSYDLTAVSQYYGGKPKAMPEQMRRVLATDGWSAVPVSWMDEYSSNDAYITFQAEDEMEPLFLKQYPIELWEREQEFIRYVMIPMKNHGIKIDLEFCIREYMRGKAVMDQCEKELGFKPSSPKALEKFLVQELELPVVKHTKACKKCYPADRRLQSLPVHTHEARPSFDKDAMAIYEEMLEHKKDARATTILTYRGWQKTTSSNYKPYLELVDGNAVLHPGYKLHGTVTRRLSCAEPNLQQIPKAGDKDWNGNLKAAFIPRDGYGLWTIDYSQLQFRMTCAYAECMALLEIFNDPDRDIFDEMAAQMGWVRSDVKTLVYLIIFGGGGKRASVAFAVDLEQGKQLVEEFYTLYPEIRQVAKDCEVAARRQGYVRTWAGGRRHFPKGSAYYRAFNAVIQGGEAEIIKDALIRISKEVCDDNCKLVLQIHDEIALEIKTGMEGQYLPKCQQIMEEVAEAFCEFVGVKIRFATSVKRWGEK